MPLLISAGDLKESALSGAAGSTPAEPLGQVRQALALIAADPEARRLLATTDAIPRPDGALACWLYGTWWCGLSTSCPPSVAEPADAARGAARLEAARRTVASVSPDWLVLAARDDVVVAAQLGATRPAGRARRASVDAVVSSSRPGLPPRPGDLVGLVGGSSGLDPAGAWWWAHAGEPDDVADAELDRWYLHAPDLTAAVGLVPLLLDLAAVVGCPLSLKCPPSAGGFSRRDAMVVYLPRDAAPAAESELRRRAGTLLALLAPEVPPLTRPLLPGVGQAEDPGPGEPYGEVSYGQLRCSQVAAVAAAIGCDAVPDDALVRALVAVGVEVGDVQRVRS